MRRITMWLLSTLSTLVLLFSYHTSTSSAASTSIVTPATEGPGTGSSGSGTTGSGSAASSSTTSGSTTGSSAAGSTTAGSTGSTSGSATSAATTYTGSAINTRYGPVQVQIIVENGKITKSIVTQVPWSNGRDQQINSQAVPVLNSEAVSAQSASIDMVSGATYTSNAYIQSLQSAIDQAHL